MRIFDVEVGEFIDPHTILRAGNKMRVARGMAPYHYQVFLKSVCLKEFERANYYDKPPKGMIHRTTAMLLASKMYPVFLFRVFSEVHEKYPLPETPVDTYDDLL